jgi:ParB family transcriptional regulator, chromosome partitioning protein
MKTINRFFFSRTQPEVAAVAAVEESDSVEVVEVPISKITPNPFQPRKTFTEEGLAELCSSIREFGVIQPLVIRRTHAGIELIAGERRMRASLLAGRETVPCIVRQASDKEMAEIALIENLQREDLHYFEEAAGYENLLTQFGLTQEILASRVGKNQSTIANKLRLLKLSPVVREYIFREKLTERHSRALLKVEGEHAQLTLLQAVVEKKMNVRETEAYIEEQLQTSASAAPQVRRPAVLRIIKDVRIFINTIGELVKQMKKVGLDVRLTQEQDDDSVTITMVVPKRR